MIQILRIPHTRRVAWIADGRFKKLLEPGTHWVWTFPGHHEFVPIELSGDLKPIPDVDPLPVDLPGTSIVAVGPHERAATFVQGVFRQVLNPGRYRWWDAVGPVRVVHFDTTAEPTPLGPDDLLPPGTTPSRVEATAGDAQAVVLHKDGLPQRTLSPGRYRAWTGSPWGLASVSLALQPLDVAPQDLLTRDQVPVRVKPAVAWRVSDPVRRLQEPQGLDQVYAAVQLALREVVTARDLDGLLADRGALGEELTARARATLPEVGLAIETVTVKDIVLPGEIKDLLNRVTLARKEAEAEAIKRREEVATTRQLANTARLLENNPVLLRLKELEGLAQIAQKIDRITLVGSGDLVKQVMLSDLGTAPKGERPEAD